MANHDLKSLIARRKAADYAFAVIGFLSIAVGLATLAALMYTLWRDAQPRLWVTKGAVAVSEGEVKGPNGEDLWPDERAREIRKLNGDTLNELAAAADDTAGLVDLTTILDVEKIRSLGAAAKLGEIVEERRFEELIRVDHVKRLAAEGKFGEFVTIRDYVPAQRMAELRQAGALGELVNHAELKRLVEEGELKSLLSHRKLEDAIDEEYGSTGGDLKIWIVKGELERRLGKLVAPDQVAALIDPEKVKAFAQSEQAVARARPKEFNSSFFATLGPSAYPETTGVLIAWVDSLLIIIVTMLAAIPLGVGAGVYLEEYAPKNKLTALIEINIANLAGVPSIIYGLMALGFFVYQLGMGRSIGTAGLTLALLVLPIVIMATREAIRAIPQHIREGSYACGATRWQTVRYHILPYSSGGILTGSIIGLSRAIGETAPLITIGALTFVTSLPFESGSDVATFQWVKSGFTAMPLLMFNLTSRPEMEFHQSAALAGIVLIMMTLSLNGVAIYLRYRLRRSIKW